MTESRRPETVEEMSARQMSRRLDSVIGRFDDLARELRLIQTRIGGGLVDDDGYAYHAARAQKAIVVALFNAGAEALTNDARQADQARTKRLAAEAVAAQIDAKAERMRTGDGATPTGFAMGAVVAEGAIIAREYAVKEG